MNAYPLGTKDTVPRNRELFIHHHKRKKAGKGEGGEREEGGRKKGRKTEGRKRNSFKI